MIHYRDLAGRDLGVKDTPSNRAVMEAAIAWTNQNIHRGASTYIWPENGLLYFGGPWLGTSDLVNHVYVPRGRNDPRTSWESPRLSWTQASLDGLIERVLRGGGSTESLLKAREDFDGQAGVAGVPPWAICLKALPQVTIYLAERVRRGEPVGRAPSTLRALIRAEGVSLSKRAEKALRFAEKAELQ